MAVAKMTGAGGGKKKAAGAKAGSKVGKAVKPNQQMKIAGKRQAAMGMANGKAGNPGSRAQAKPKVNARRQITAGDLRGSFANNLGEGAVGWGRMRFDPTTNSKIPLYGSGLPTLLGRVGTLDPAIMAHNTGDKNSNVWSWTNPRGQQMTGDLKGLINLIAGMQAAGIRGFDGGVSGWLSDADQARKYENYITNGGAVSAPPGYSDHNYGRAWDLMFSKAQQGTKAYDRFYRILASLGMNQHNSEDWHWAIKGTPYTP